MEINKEITNTSFKKALVACALMLATSTSIAAGHLGFLSNAGTTPTAGAAPGAPAAPGGAPALGAGVAGVAGPISVLVLGSGSPIATDSGRAAAGYIIFIEGQPRILMDVGGGTFQRIAESGVDISDLETILLSHLHLDHTADLSAAIKNIYFQANLAGGARTAPIHIYGPGENGNTVDYSSTIDYADAHYAVSTGAERYLNTFVSDISNGRNSFAYVPHDLNPTVDGAAIEEVIRTSDGVLVEAIAVDHANVPAVAYRVSYQGFSIAYSGDTRSTGDNMITISQDADLLIYDTAITELLPPNPFFHELHTSPTRIGEVAGAANVGELILSHLTPVTEPLIGQVEQSISQNYSGVITPANDLDVYNLGQ